MNTTVRLFFKIRLLALFVLAAGTAQAQNEWPVEFTIEGTRYQMFAPQPESLEGMRFSARSAISMQRSTDRSPVFGALWGDGLLEMDRSTRLGKLIKFTVTDVRFPDTKSDGTAELKTLLSEAIVANAPPISMDWLVAALENEKLVADQYQNDPPEIIYRETPAALVFIDGDPQYEELQAKVDSRGDPLYEPSGQKIERVLNTPYMILRSGNEHYLYGSGLWFKTSSLDGPWKHETNVPETFKKIASRVDETAELVSTGERKVPEIIVRYEPAELVSFDGAPQYKPIQGTELLTATNTDRSVFMDIKSQEQYLLAAGRWFKTRDPKSGTWQFVPADRLPEEFKNIPEGSDRDGVLAHVAGTDAAREAARDANIPQTAQVDRRTATVNVTYTGDPQFERVNGTNIEYAINANTDVLRIGGKYHVCDNGIWFEGPTPDGPWQVSTEVPSEVNSIPPSSPVHNVRYVYIYDHTPDIVYVGYTPGYLGSYVQHGVVIYGTGFYYRPWPVFWRPRPWTWGFNMYYDPWYGWGLGWNWGYNWFHPAWNWWGPHPYAWGWWGPYAWHPPCCADAAYAQYGHRPSVSGRSERVRSDNGTAMRSSSDLYSRKERPGVEATAVERGAGNQMATASRQDHFTDAAGNIYRRNGDRTQVYGDGSWTKVPAQRPTPQGDAGRQREPVTTAPSVERSPSRAKPVETSPQRPSNPYNIQRDRQRGEQRQRFMTQPSRGQQPSRGGGSVAPSRGGGGGSAPSRSGGTQRSR
jgi:hypothetical protein